MSDTPRKYDPLNPNPERRRWTTTDRPLPDETIRMIQAAEAEKIRRYLEQQRLRRRAS
jgi:hypothetical protein